MSEPLLPLENDYKTRYGIVRAALERNERTTYAHRALIDAVHREIIAIMIVEKSDDQQRALYALLKKIEAHVAATDPSPRHLKSKI